MRRQAWVALVASALSLSAIACDAVGAAAKGRHRYTMPSAAMEPTIRIRQVIETRPVSPGKYRPRRGDIILFTADDWDPSAERGTKHIKRVIAIAGDIIRCCSRDGKVVLNNAPLTEPYVATSAAEAPFRAVTVPPGRLWVMGDNRAASQDSRGHVDDRTKGTIAASSVTDIVIEPRRR